jgi:hypothetical protein
MAPPRGRRRSPIVTLSSDLGSVYSAQIKAVLARSIDPARVIELTSDLPAHGIMEGAFLLRAMAGGFPAGTIHLAVVDPGVGGRRAAVVFECRDGSCLVGPDNGLLFPLAEELGRPRAFSIDPARVGVHTRVGTTFDGRDLFAPAVVRLALGGEAEEVGPPLEPSVLRLPRATHRPRGATGEVLHVDRFGNLITNIPSRWIPAGTRRVSSRIGRRLREAPWVSSYEALAPGSMGVLGSSFGTVEISARERRAADALGATPGTGVVLTWTGGRRRGSIGK